MKLTNDHLFWKGKTSDVNCSWETWLSRCVDAVFIVKIWLFIVQANHHDSFFFLLKVRVLLIELEEARGNHVVHEEELSSTDVSSTCEVISQHLVSFRSIEELQKQNQRLLVALRELSDAQEKEESEISRKKYVGLIYSSLICFYKQKCQLSIISV